MKSGSRSGEFKVAYIGGGSMFVPSILNGIADCMKKKEFNVCVSLYDVHRERAERMRRYAGIVKNESVPITAESTALLYT